MLFKDPELRHLNARSSHCPALSMFSFPAPQKWKHSTVQARKHSHEFLLHRCLNSPLLIITLYFNYSNPHPHWHPPCQLPVPTSFFPTVPFPHSCLVLFCDPLSLMSGLDAEVPNGGTSGKFPMLSIDIRTQVTWQSGYGTSFTPTTHCTISVPSLPHTTHKAETRLFCLEQSSPATSHRKCPLAEQRLTCLLLLPPFAHKLVLDKN